MCGIIGILGPEAAIDKKRIHNVLSTLRHRGPDAQDYVLQKNLFLGHTRLSIIDTRNVANQPFFSADKKLVITYNGEIYNYKELRDELIAHKHHFKTNSDTEVVLNAYKQWGVGCVKRFIGMFAFAIYDFKKKHVFLARDRIGEKPLYYYHKNKTFSFSSELPALLAANDIKKDIDYEALTYYFTYNLRHTPWDKTIFKQVRKVPPAHYAIFDGKKLTFTRYWKPSFKKAEKTSKEWLQEYEQVLRRAVNRSCVSDVPVGLFLSGGVDSSSIAALLENKNITSYTIGFDKADPEVKRAKQVAKKLGIKNKTIYFSNNDVIKKGPKILRELVGNFGEPVNLLQAVYTNLIMKEVKKDKLKVMIGGNGADELFYGYDGMNMTLLLTKLLRVNDALPIFKLLKLSNILPGKLKLYFKLLELPNSQRKPYLYNYYAQQKKKLFTQDIQKQIEKKDFSKTPSRISALCPTSEFIEHMQWLGLTFENEHSITIVSDLGGMSKSVEIRTPFLDKDLMEFSFSMPTRYKVRSIWNKLSNKWIMRKFVERKLGKDIAYAKKMGFGYGIDAGELIRTHWNTDFKNTVFGSLSQAQIFNMDAVKHLYNEHMHGADHHKVLLGVYIFSIWHEQFIK